MIICYHVATATVAVEESAAVVVLAAVGLAVAGSCDCCLL